MEVRGGVNERRLEGEEWTLLAEGIVGIVFLNHQSLVFSIFSFFEVSMSQSAGLISSLTQVDAQLTLSRQTERGVFKHRKMPSRCFRSTKVPKNTHAHSFRL